MDSMRDSTGENHHSIFDAFGSGDYTMDMYPLTSTPRLATSLHLIKQSKMQCRFRQRELRHIAKPKKRQTRYTCDSQDKLDNLVLGLESIVSPNDLKAFAQRQTRQEEKDALKFLHAACEYRLDSKRPDQIKRILLVRDFLFDQDSATLRMPFAVFLVVAPLWLSFYKQAGNVYVKRSGTSSMTYKCRCSAHKGPMLPTVTDESEDVEEDEEDRSSAKKVACPHSMRVEINFKAETVTIDFNKKHDHALSELLSLTHSHFLLQLRRSFYDQGLRKSGLIKRSMISALLGNRSFEESTEYLSSLGVFCITTNWIAKFLQRQRERVPLESSRRSCD